MNKVDIVLEFLLEKFPQTIYGNSQGLEDFSMKYLVIK